MRLFCIRASCQCHDDGKELKAIGQNIERYYIALEIVSYWAKYHKISYCAWNCTLWVHKVRKFIHLTSEILKCFHFVSFVLHVNFFVFYFTQIWQLSATTKPQIHIYVLLWILAIYAFEKPFLQDGCLATKRVTAKCGKDILGNFCRQSSGYFISLKKQIQDVLYF